MPNFSTKSINYALRTSWRRSGPTIMVSDNFLDQLIGHRDEESVKGTSRHRHSFRSASVRTMSMYLSPGGIRKRSIGSLTPVPRS